MATHMRTTKTLITATSLAALTGLVLTGCSTASSSDSGGDSGEKVTITYSNFISNGGNEENLQKIVDAFEEENPDITVEVQTAPYSDYFTQLQTDLAAGTQADVF